MPCRVDPTPEELAADARRRDQAIADPLNARIDALSSDLADLTAMLCGVMSALDAKGLLDTVAVAFDQKEAGITWEATSDWWHAHLELDRQRRDREARQRWIRRQEILSRLSDEEREILGIEE